MSISEVLQPPKDLLEIIHEKELEICTLKHEKTRFENTLYEIFTENNQLNEEIINLKQRVKQLETVYVLQGVVNSEMQNEIDTLKKVNKQIQNEMNELKQYIMHT